MRKNTYLTVVLTLLLLTLATSGCKVGTLGGDAGSVERPEDLAASPLSSSEIVVSWSDVSDEEDGYTVERAADVSGSPGSWSTRATLGQNIESYTDSGLTEATTYWYRVYARGPDEDSAKTDAVSGETRLAEPLTFTATAASASAVDLEWTDRSSAEEGYKIERADDDLGVPGAWELLVDLAANTVDYQDTGLDAGTTYWYRLYAYSSQVEDSNYTRQVSVTTN